MTDRAPDLPIPRSASLFQWRRLDRLETDHELIWLATSAGSAALGYWWISTGRSFPLCTFRVLTGCPCPTCGATRSTLKLIQGDFGSAIALNPLYVAGLVFLLVYNAYAATVLIGGLPRLRIAQMPHGWGRRLRWGIAALVALNWGWLVAQGV